MRGSTLKEILTEQNTNINELARRLSISPQTLYSMVKRDNQKVDFDLMMRICSELNVPVERMCENLTVAKLPNSDEWKLIQQYRELDKSGKEIVRMILGHEHKRVNRTKPRVEEKLK